MTRPEPTLPPARSGAFGALFVFDKPHQPATFGLLAVVFHRTGNLWIVATMHAFGSAYAVGTFGVS